MENNKNCDKIRVIEATYSCDNYADVYVGDCNKVLRKVASNSSLEAVSFKAKATCEAYLYFVCWSDNAGLNGLLAQLRGTNTVYSGTHAKWEVFPTGINFSSHTTRPSDRLINTELKKAHCKKWKAVTKGSANGKRPFRTYPSINNNAHFIWYDSGKDSTTRAPFQGFNHDEFLIFRFPIKELFKEECHDCKHECECVDNCLCSVCAKTIQEEQKVLKTEALSKTFLIKGKENNSRRCKTPYSGETCSTLDLPNLEPCFYLHWGDSSKDQMETHDDEILYITACNPYSNLRFRGLIITNITIVPKGSTGTNTPTNNTIQLVPNRLVRFGDLCECTCTSQALYLSIQNAKPQDYEILVEYCIEQIEINQDNTGKTRFPITLIKS